MRRTANVFPVIGAVVALEVLFSPASLANDGGDPEQPAKQEERAGKDRWVPSLAITAGATFQNQDGFAESYLLADGSPPPLALQPACEPGDPAPCPGPRPVTGDDLAVAPFVGGSLQIMTPALPIPTSPRLFLSAEILPTFAADRDVALLGDPDCVRGPEPTAPCARDEEEGQRSPEGDLPAKAFGEDAANGQGIRTTAEIDTLVFGASMGVAFPLRVRERQLWIKPSVGWISYEVQAEGLVVDAACDPTTRCTDFTPILGLPPVEGFLRETILTASDSQRFHGIGPGLDVEMDTGRFGPIGSSLFLGASAYRVLGNRTIAFGATESYTDQISEPGTDVAFGDFAVEVDPWMFRAHVGIRFHWLGSRQ